MIKITKQKISAIVGSTLAVALITSPAMVSAAFSPANTTINATLDSVISISTGTTVAIAVTPTAGGVVSSQSDTVSVSTNNTAGYRLTLSDADTNVNLVSGANNIAAHNGTFASPTVLAGNSWGYAVAGGNFSASYAAEPSNPSSTSKWAGVPSSASPQQLKTTAATASGDQTVVWYGVRATSAQAAGVYSDTVTYTATTN
ncbi:hypothetical protein HY312_01615 [Candidatus Saccharibacteria bacterium]|nr:hypothetical protein [Candidatus Saccharibacteria bacterium]